MLDVLLALASLTLPPVQAGAPPYRGPRGSSLSLVGVGEATGQPVLLGQERWFDPTAQELVNTLIAYDVSPTGALSIRTTVPDSLPFDRVYGYDGSHVAVVDDGHVARLLIESGGTWVEGPPLRPQLILGTYRLFGNEVALDGQRVAHALHGSREITIQSISGTAPLVLEAVLAPIDGHTHRGHALDQDLLITASGELLSANGDFRGTEIRVFERDSVGQWSEVLPRLAPPAGFEWSNGLLSFDVSDGRIAITAGDCGEVAIYERAAGGGFARTETIRSPRQLITLPGICLSPSSVTIRGDDLVMVTGEDRAGERYRWDGTAWSPRERARSGEGSFNWYGFAGDFLVSTSQHDQGIGHSTWGLQVHPRVDEPSGVEITCAGPFQSSLLQLFTSAPCTFAHRPLRGWVHSQDPSAPTLVVAGRASGVRPLGTESTLCVGGALRLIPLDLVPYPTTGAGASFEIDPVAASIAPGETVYFQAWQREGGVPGGRTTHGVAVTFAR